jgi:hypothetical protein
MKKIILFIALIVGVLSCKSDDLASVNPLGGGSMTAKIAGQSWSATTVQVVQASTANQLLSIGGSSLTAKSGIGINFDLTKGKVEAGKTYTCNYNSFAEITHDSDATNTNMYYTTDSPSGSPSGTIKVETWDGTNITGTFSGTLYDSSAKKSIVITEGKFSGKKGVL